MPILHLNNVSFQFENGDALFNNISCSLVNRRVGLVGRNGIGKSVFSKLLTKDITPTEGTVSLNATVALYKQIPLDRTNEHLTLAQFMQVDHVLDALEQIQNGSIEQRYFDLVAEQWDLKATLMAQLEQLNLPADLNFPTQKLSGGQLAMLQLWQLFKDEKALLILDEPSNHLDEQGKQWLIAQLADYSGHVFLISHDRQLLNEMEETWELSNLGLKQFGGNYDFYASHKSLEAKAIERELSSAKNELKKLEKQSQKNREKAEQRASKGNKSRKDGSQPKILLNAMRDNATASASSRLKNDKSRQKHIELRDKAAREKQEQINVQKMHITSDKPSSKRLVNIQNGLLPFGNAKALNLTVYGNSKLHLKGHNGCGKSTLLKVLINQNALTDGELSINTACCYLDQHFKLLNEHSTLRENVKQHCSHIDESNIRTLLAGIGFRNNTVERQVSALSGGEKMKLAMLIVSHQVNQPLLLLDEPDNHLDIDSKCLLADALNAYQGAFILVSHDEVFAAQTGVTAIHTL